MRFRTTITVTPSARAIDHGMHGLSLGSCFATNIAERLHRAKFPIGVNPFGVLYNPESIALAVEALSQGRVLTEADLVREGDLWSSFSFHGSFSSADPGRALAQMNASVAEGARALAAADYVVVTFGTAWVYELADAFYTESPTCENIRPAFPVGGVVANCHKFPARHFRRRRMSVEEITARWSKLLEGPLAGKRIILTVSPVRHLKDGFAGNAVSKATLLLAASQLAEKYADADYFPAFEIMNDDLRDYRFYADDMLHPSAPAVDYIWDRFAEAFFAEDTMRAIREFEKIAAAAHHRPLNPLSAEYAAFRASMLDKVKELQARYPVADLSVEADFFSR